ncbi:MAG: Tol-Pal system beta propeller repeat protein TolB [Gammaproteobacteria bacterium]|nr:Tol-Pal system beta propeller repeat protein TolB [Gammaproteobacteria bacterium]
MLLILLALTAGAYAKPLTITITQGIEAALPIAVVPFRVSGAVPPSEDLAQIVSNDLVRTGQFKAFPVKDMLSKPTDPATIKYQNWRILGVESLVIGQVENTGPDNYTISFWLQDVFQAKQMVAYKIPATSKTLRAAAHKISDIVYEQLTGVKGAFSTRIAYVTAEGDFREKRYSLWIADSDGENAQEILRSKEPIMSPSWSPDGKRIAYASLEQGGAQKVYIQNWQTTEREQVKTPLSGLHGAPSWSPKGDKLAFTITKNGNADIYTLHLKTQKMRKLTTHWAIDTEPVWTPDGGSIIFTSDRGGRPQLYRVAADGGKPRRLTFEGRENLKAAVSPDGKMIAMVHDSGNGNGYQIATMELDSGAMQILTEGRLDESPSFAPNGSMIIYATTGRRGELAAVSVDGKIKQSLSYQEDVREPAWSPFNN